MSIVSALIGPITGLLDQLIPDSDQKARLAHEIAILADRQAGDIIKSEAESEHWITSAWRPLLMMVITAIVAVSYLIFPVINLFVDVPLMIELPDQLWNLLQIGVGGYVVGRSGEKVMKEYKK